LARYLFATRSNNPCDLCDLFEGEHDTPPSVPVHPECMCEVEVVSPPGSSGQENEEIDFLEVRNVESMSTESFETFTKTYQNGSDEDAEVVLPFSGLGVEADLDDPLTLDDVDIDTDDAPETDSETVTLPAHSAGTIDVELKTTGYVVKAELWRIYTITTEDVALVEEEHVDDVGGTVEVRVIESVDVDGSPDDPAEGGGGYDDDDEVPA
jgi:hypothetical protein